MQYSALCNAFRHREPGTGHQRYLALIARLRAREVRYLLQNIRAIEYLSEPGVVKIKRERKGKRVRQGETRGRKQREKKRRGDACEMILISAQRTETRQGQTSDPRDADETQAGCRNQLLPERFASFQFQGRCKPGPPAPLPYRDALPDHIKSVSRLNSHLVDRPVLATSAPRASGARGAQASGLIFALLRKSA